MKKIAVLLLGLLLSIMLVACGDGEPDPITFASYTKGFEATTPGGWTRIPEEDANGTNLLLESPGGSAAFMIFAEPKIDYNITAQEYYDAVIQMTAYDLNTLPEEEVDLRDAQPLTINGEEAQGCIFNYTDESGLNMVFQLYFFETEDSFVRVNASAKVSTFEEYQPILNDIVESIVVK